MKILDKIQIINTDKIIPYINNAKKHPDTQIKKIASSIKNYGFTVPLLIDSKYEIIAGHGRYLAAKELGMKELPCIMRDDLTPAQIKAFRIADNKVAESDWDFDMLKLELDEKYCDVIVQRYVNFTGNEDIILNGEKIKWSKKTL